MNTTSVAGANPTKTTRANRRQAAPAALYSGRDANEQMIQQAFDGLNAQAPIVEHLTIPGFMRLIDHRWSLDDIRRFGDRMGQMAESMCLAYLTATDASLGILRMFPAPLLRRVYDIMAPQFGWPVIVNVDTPELEEVKKKRDAIKANERALRRLGEVIADTEDVAQLEVLRASVKVIEAQTAELRGETLPEPTA